MKCEATLPPPNSILMVMDYQSGEPPESMGGNLISVSPTCVVVGTLSEQYGETYVALTDEPEHSMQSGLMLVFDGDVIVTSNALSVVTALNETLLSISVRPGKVRVRIWVNDNTEPDQVEVVVN